MKPQLKAPVETAETRAHNRASLRDAAAVSLQSAETMLRLLSESYEEGRDGKFSAVHPRNGFNSMARQIEKLKKALKTAKV